MQTADVADDRLLQPLEILRRLLAALANGVEPLEVDAEREEMDAIAVTGGAFTQLLGRDEHEVGLPEEALFARDDLPGARRARREVVNAVVDRHLRIDHVNQVEGKRRRQERPENRPAEAHGFHPAPERAPEQRPVDPAREPEVRERQQQRRVDEQVRPVFTEAFRAPPPVADALPDAREVADLRRPDARVFDKQDAMALGGHPRHDFLMALPDEVPVDRRDAQDVRQPSGHRTAADFDTGAGRRRTMSRDEIRKSVDGASE